MSRATQMDQTISGLLAVESYRSPWIPTRRLGEDALIAVAAPFRQTSDVSIAPSSWFACTWDFSTLLAFSRTTVVTPVSDFQPEVFAARAANTMTTREAHAELWRLADSAWPDFFASRPAPRGLGVRMEAALAASVPSHLHAWLHQCCADYFAWSSTAPAG